MRKSKSRNRHVAKISCNKVYLKPLFTQIFGSKGFFVLRQKTLEFPTLCVTRHLAGDRESSYVSVTDFLRFCYLNIPYLRINITLIFMSSSSNEFTDISRKPQKEMFLLVSDSHICAPQRDTTNLGVSIQSLKNLGETFFRISRMFIIAQT